MMHMKRYRSLAVVALVIAVLAASSVAHVASGGLTGSVRHDDQEPGSAQRDDGS